MHPNWAFLIAAAIAVLGVLGAVGVLRSRSAPAPATAPSGGSPIPALPPTVTVDLLATAPVQVVVTTDGVVNFQGMLRTDESRSFDASTKIEIQLDPGGVTVVTVNGHRVGKPGPKGGTYARIFYPKDFRRSPSPNAP